MKRYLLVSLFVALLPLTPARGGEVDISGNLETQVRAFWQHPAWVGQDDRALQPTVVLMTEIRWYNAAGNQRIALIPYLRWDATDEERSLADLREAYWALEGDNWEVLPDAAARLGRNHGVRDAVLQGTDLRGQRR